MKHLTSPWQEAAPYADRSPFHVSRMYCTVYQGKPGIDSKTKNASRFPFPSPSHYIAFTKLEVVVVGEDQMQYFSQTTGGTTCQ